MKQVELYSDGSSLGNPGPGGWGTILKCCNKEKELSGGEMLSTNNIMELTGVIRGLQALKEPCHVTIYSDSNYVIKGIDSWLNNWIKNNWKTSNKKPVKNKELWKQYLEVSEVHNIKTVWIKGHNGHIENERCDVLATTEAKKFLNK